jgi:hypothetical protein
MALLNFPARGNRGDYVPAGNAQVRSTVSVVAILCAIGSFVMSARDNEFFGFILALVAIVAGMLGGVRALSPRVSGGMLSIAAVVLGVLAILFTLVAMLF